MAQNKIRRSVGLKNSKERATVTLKLDLNQGKQLRMDERRKPKGVLAIGNLKKIFNEYVVDSSFVDDD
jgi:DUF438 domain-containing protein